MLVLSYAMIHWTDNFGKKNDFEVLLDCSMQEFGTMSIIPSVDMVDLGKSSE